MTKEQKVEAFSMILDGCTYQEVADNFGVSKQRIHQLFGCITREPKSATLSEHLVEGCVFPNLAEAILKEKFSARGLFIAMYDMTPEEMYVGNVSYYSVLLKNRLIGKTAFTSAEWLKLYQIFSIPLEKLMDSDGVIKCAWKSSRRKKRESGDLV